MNLDKIDLAELARPLPLAELNWRITATKGRVAQISPYINARQVMDVLDRVCGPGRWQVSHREVPFVDVDMPRIGFITTISIFIDGQWVSKSDGAPQTGTKSDTFYKGGISKSFVRTAVHWGIGRWIYDVPSIPVDYDPSTKEFSIPKLPSQKDIAKFHMTGTELYGKDEWDSKRKELVSSITQGLFTSSKMITQDQMEFLTKGMRKRLLKMIEEESATPEEDNTLQQS